MPEGPEVTIIRENLNDYLKNFYLININIFPTSRYRNRAPNNFITTENSLPLKLLEVKSKGKLIYWLFEKKITLLNTLGMSGIWVKDLINHVSIEMEFQLDDKKKKIYFVDTRHFGTLKFLTSKKDLQDKLKQLGPDILNDRDMNFELFKTRILKYKHYNITKSLMDQKIISGIGNYLKSEILYDSKISPLWKIQDLTEKDLYRLYKSCGKIINNSYKNRGVTMKDFTDIDRKKGKHQFSLEVYCKKTDKHGNDVLKITTPDKRTTYWVPEIQL